MVLAWSSARPPDGVLTPPRAPARPGARAFPQEQGAALVDAVVRRGGYVFVCGDGAAMAKDVQACLAELLCEHAGLSAEAAAAELAALTQQKRYVRDIWS
jgi:hypothetical protein